MVAVHVLLGALALSEIAWQPLDCLVNLVKRHELSYQSALQFPGRHHFFSIRTTKLMGIGLSGIDSIGLTLIS